MADIQVRLPRHEEFILTKFHKDCKEIVDFLLRQKFLVCALFYASVFTKLLWFIYFLNIIGVPGNLEKHKDAVNTESKGIKAHFNIDDSGLLHVTGIESVFEKTITVEEQEKAEAERIGKPNF